MQIDHRREFFKAIIRALAHRYDDQIIFSNNNSIKKFKIMATSTKLWLYDKSTKTRPRQGYHLLIFQTQYWLLRIARLCFCHGIHESEACIVSP